MYKTVRISKRLHDKIEAVREALDCTFLEAADALIQGSQDELISICRSNLDKARSDLAKDKAAAALERAQKRSAELHGD